MLLPALVIAWEQCVVDRENHLASLVVPDPSSASQNPAASPLFPPAPPAPAKMPKELQPGQWQKGIDDYERDSKPPRFFPTNKLFGAEEVLARLLWEKNVSRMHTPMTLGQVVQLRSYTKHGAINLASKEENERWGLKDGAFVALTPKSYSPSERLRCERCSRRKLLGPHLGRLA